MPAERTWAEIQGLLARPQSLARRLTQQLQLGDCVGRADMITIEDLTTLAAHDLDHDHT